MAPAGSGQRTASLARSPFCGGTPLPPISEGVERRVCDKPGIVWLRDIRGYAPPVRHLSSSEPDGVASRSTGPRLTYG
jgi:hypothetical protein